MLCVLCHPLHAHAAMCHATLCLACTRARARVSRTALHASTRVAPLPACALRPLSSHAALDAGARVAA